MAKKPTRREIVLLVLLAAVAIIVVVYDFGAAGLGTNDPNAALDAIQVGEAPTVNLARLSLDPAGYDPQGRDLFAYGSPPRVKAPPPPPPKPTKVARPPQQNNRVKRKAPVQRKKNTAPAAARAPQPQFEFLGYLGPKDARVFAFEEGEEIFIAGVGEVVKDDFKVLELQYKTVVLGYVDDKWKGQTAELEMKEARSRRR